MMVPALLLLAALQSQPQPQQQPQPAVDDPPHDISQVDVAPLGGAIAVPLPENQRRRLKRYDLPELAGAKQALGSQLIDGRLPKPLLDYDAVAEAVHQRISIFEGGLVIIEISGSGGTIRKKVIIPPDALKSYCKTTTAEALQKIRPDTLVPPRNERSATIRVYDTAGVAVERVFDPAAVQSKAMSDQVAPLQDLLRAISDDRAVTNTVANYLPKAGDELVDDARRVWRIDRIMDGKVVALACESEPTIIYIDVHDLANYFIGKPGAATR